MKWREHNFIRMCKGYEHVDYIFNSQLGCIAWHFSTGGNLEVIELEAAIPGLGQGYILYRDMCKKLLEQNLRPRHSVIGYRRTDNEEAAYFYKKMGWNQVDLGPSLYAGGGATLLWTTWNQLLTRCHLI